VITANRILIEKHGVDSVNFLISIRHALGFLFLDKFLVFEIQIEHNLLFVLFENVRVNTSRFEHAKSIFKVFLKQVIFLSTRLAD